MSQEMRDLINKFNQLINENVGEVEESGYSSVARTLRGLRPSIKKIAILTAENPKGKETSKEYNETANHELERVLVQSKFGYKKVKGSYGKTRENSFIVFNISLDSAISLGSAFDQESIIYGETGGVNDKGEVHMSFILVGTDKNKPDDYKNIIGNTEIFVNRDDATDTYSEINGKKFVLPFYGVTDRLIDKNGKPYDLIKSYKGSKWDGGKTGPTDIEINYNIKEQLVKLEAQLNNLEERAMESYGSNGYNLRSRIMEILRG